MGGARGNRVNNPEDDAPISAETALMEHEVLTELHGPGASGLVLPPKTSTRRKAIYVTTAVVSIFVAGAIAGMMRERHAVREVEPNVDPGDFFEFQTPETYSVPFKSLRLKGSHGTQLNGWLFERDREAPTLVYFHGLRHDFRWSLPELVKIYQNTNCNLVIMNYRDCRLNRTDTDLIVAFDDMKNAVEDLKSKCAKLIDPSKVFLMGSGVGCEVAVDVAAAAPEAIAGLLLENPRQGLPIMRLRFPWMESFRYMTPNWLRNMMLQISPTAEEKLNANSVPVAFFASESFSSPISRDWFMKSGAKDRWLVLPPGTADGVDFWRDVIGEFMERVVGKERLGTRFFCWLGMDDWNRKVRTLATWSHLYLGFKVAQVRSRMLPEQQRAEYWKGRHSKFAQAIWTNIADLRGWWVKVGQFLSTRADLLPDEYVAELAKVQDMMPTSPFEIIKEIVEQELEKRLDEVFDYFEPTAIASASIGQVHKARLRGSQEWVVVKVQHPNVDKLLSQDMRLLTQLSWAFGLLEKGLNFSSVLEEWQKQAAQELDFRLEMQSQVRVREAMKRANLNVKIPDCYPDLTTRRVMVMEFIDGFKCTDRAMLAKHNVNVHQLCTDITKSFAYQIHIDGLFNGDPHPGNIMVQVDEKTGAVTPVLIDWGLVKQFTTRERLAFARTIVAVANADVMGLMDAFHQMGFRFKRPTTQKRKRGKADSIETSPIPVDPEVYMDAIGIMLAPKPQSSKSMVPSQDKKAVMNAVRDKNARSNVQSMQEKLRTFTFTYSSENPLDDWPKDIIFFLRVASLLHGLSVQLKAQVPFFQVLLQRAEEAIVQSGSVASDFAHLALVFGNASAGVQRWTSIRAQPRSLLEWRIHKHAAILFAQGDILGCQVVVWHRRTLVADVALGTMGPYDSRPVTNRTLFTAFSLCNILLVTMLLRLVHKGKLKLSDCISEWWNMFIRGGKRLITVEQLLTHQSGIHSFLPSNLTLAQITNYRHMIKIIEDSPLACIPGKCGHYPFYCVGWMLHELLNNVAKMRPQKFLRSVCLKEWRLRHLSRSLYFPLPARALIAAKEAFAQDEQATFLAELLPTPPLTNPVSSAECSEPLKAQNGRASAASADVRSVKLPPEADSIGSESNAASNAESEDDGGVDHRDNVSVMTSVTRKGLLTPPVPHTGAWNSAPSTPITTNRLLPVWPGDQAGMTGGNSQAPASRSERGNSLVGLKPIPGKFEVALSDNEIYNDIVKTTTMEQVPRFLLQGAIRRRASMKGIGMSSMYLGDSRLSMLAQLDSMILPPAGFSTAFEPTDKGDIEDAGKAKQRDSALEIILRLASCRRDLGIARAMTLAAASAHEKESLIETPGKADFEAWLAIHEETRMDFDQAPILQRGSTLSKYTGRQASMRQVVSKREQDASRIAAFMAKQAETVRHLSAFALMRERPHLMDPLLFDSRDVAALDIPCANARVTARAMATLLHAVNRGHVLSSALLTSACSPQTYDSSVEARVGTGGLPPLFGLGYQLLPYKRCDTHLTATAQLSSFSNLDGVDPLTLVKRLPPGADELMRQQMKSDPRPTSNRVVSSPNCVVIEGQMGGASSPVRTKSGRSERVRGTLAFKEAFDRATPSTASSTASKEASKIAYAFGGSDLGGNLAFSFPESELTVCILVNDMMSGSTVSHKLLGLILQSFGLKMCSNPIASPTST